MPSIEHKEGKLQEKILFLKITNEVSKKFTMKKLTSLKNLENY